MAVEWFYTTNKQQMGPVSWDELRELANVGILKPHDMVWSDGMDEWVKAINQSGLFGEDDGDGPGSVKKAKFKPGKPPPGRRTRKRVDEDEDEDDEEEARKERRANRKKEEDRYKMGVGVRIALTLAGVGLLIVLMVGCLGGLAWMSFGGGGGGGGGAPKGGGPVAGAPVRENYAYNNIGPMRHQDRVFRFTQGRRVVITVTNQLANPQTDVDLLVLRGNEMNNRNAFVADTKLPQVDRNCRVEFIVPATDNYRVRVANLGPGIANSCQVSVQEQ